MRFFWTQEVFALFPLSGLPWAFPRWVGKEQSSPYQNPDVTASYVVSWIIGASHYHNLNIDYVGVSESCVSLIAPKLCLG